MVLELRLGEDFDVKPGANGYSGPALAMCDETLECSHTEQRVGTQGVNTITVVSCRETERWGVSVRYRAAVLESRFAFSMNSHVSHLSGRYQVLLPLLSSTKAGNDRGVVKLL